MRTPEVYTADQIKHWGVQTRRIDGQWFLARPMSRSGTNLKMRIVAAWKVFTGKADVLTWNEINND